MAQNYGLGRGLASLIPQKRKSVSETENKSDKITEPKEDFNYFGSNAVFSQKTGNVKIAQKTEGDNPKELDVSLIVPNPHQPRHRFDEMKLKELAASIKEHGIIQPLVVSQSNGQYEIIAGERRFQAAKIAGLTKVPVIIRGVSDQQKLELAIIENVQRHDLNVVEEAKAFKKLSEEFDMDQEEIALKMGKSRSAVANKLRILSLPVEIQKGLIEEKITEGHAKAILSIENPEKQKALYDLILKNSMTVRQTENKTKEIVVKTHKRSIQIDPEIKQVEDELSGTLGTKVKLTKSGNGGRIIIDYYSQEELNNILEKISATGGSA